MISQSFKQKGGDFFFFIDVKVKELEFSTNKILFVVISSGRCSGRVIEGDLFEWSGYLGRVPEIDAVIEDAALWNNKWIGTHFHPGSLKLGDYQKIGQKLVEEYKPIYLLQKEQEEQEKERRKKRAEKLEALKEKRQRKDEVISVDWEHCKLTFRDKKGALIEGCLFHWTGYFNRVPEVGNQVIGAVKDGPMIYPYKGSARTYCFQMGEQVVVSLKKIRGQHIELRVPENGRKFRPDQCPLCWFFEKSEERHGRVMGWCHQAEVVKIKIGPEIAEYPCHRVQLINPPKVSAEEQARKELLALPFMGPKVLANLEKECGQIESIAALLRKKEAVQKAFSHMGGWSGKRLAALFKTAEIKS